MKEAERSRGGGGRGGRVEMKGFVWQREGAGLDLNRETQTHAPLQAKLLAAAPITSRDLMTI